MSEHLVEISGIHQSFRAGFWLKHVEVLKDVSFNIPKGSVFGFIGANGAGKTTLIHLMVGIRKPTSGRILIKGLDSTTPIARSVMGYLPERPYFHEFLTGKELLTYMGRLSGMSGNDINTRIPKVLELVGMKHAGDTELKSYSKGMLQRIGIAQALLHDPELLVFDEPMSGLDPRGRREMRELMQDLAKKGKTIFFSTHLVHDVELICSHLAVIDKGKIIRQGRIDGFMADGASLESLFDRVQGDL